MAINLRTRGARRLRSALARTRYHGGAHQCPVCRASVRNFAPARSGRPNDRCPVCGALERHRYLWWYLHERTPLFEAAGASLLHLAPEPSLAIRLARELGSGYLSADLQPGRAMVEADITALDFPDDHFDMVLCSHILEHIADDRAAMREMGRVTKPDGLVLVMVPMRGQHTDEDPTVTDPDSRQRRFGQADHVRYYGRDIADRLARAGIEARFEQAGDTMGVEERDRFAIRAAVDVIRGVPTVGAPRL